MPDLQEAFRQSGVRPSDLPSVALGLLQAGAGANVWALDGEMGAGKTTLIKALAAAMGTPDHVSSPTFAIVHEYLLPQGRCIYHFDCYRLAGEAEAQDIGMEEYFGSGQPCWVEWPSRIEGLLPARYFLVKISVQEDGLRLIEGEYVARALRY